MTRSRSGRGLVGRWCEERQKIVYYDKGAIDDYRAECRNNPVAPMVVSDTIDWMKHPGTGQYTNSRSTFDQISKACGLVPWEEPSDWNGNGVCRELNDAELQEIEDDIDQATRRAFNDLKWGQVELSDDQQQYAKEVNSKVEAATGKPSVIKGTME